MDDSAEAWSDFFISAGIPVTVAENYAVTFSQHRVRIDMLKEITKDILIDMGIKAMGDIIAILRHAKNLSQQDELRSDATKTSIKKLSTITPSAGSVSNQSSSSSTSRQHLSQRTPITTPSRSGGSNISSIGGNKIQSRLSLSSGALLSSSNNSSSLNSRSNNKRPSSSNLPDSLSKRLKAPEEARPVRNLPEKTLTVHYPSSSAIARAQQRISAGTSAQTSLVSTNSSIKSRLGSAVSENGKFKSDMSNNLNNQSIRNNNNSSSYPKHLPQASNRDHSREGRPVRGSDLRRQQDRPKSTVFSRLGETSSMR